MKILASIFSVFLIVSLGILLGIPSIISTRFGKEQAIKLYNSQIPGSLSVKRISLSWIGSQIFEGVTLKSLEGETVLSFDSFRTETPLIRFLLFGPSLGKTELKGLYLNVIEEYPEVTNLQQALGRKKIQFNKKKKNVFIQLPLTTKIALKRKKPRNFKRPQAIICKNVDLLIDSLSFAKPIRFKLKGITEQGELKGSFNIEATLLSGFAQKWQFNRKAKVAISAEIENFPVDMLDIVLTLDQPELQGILRDIMGDRLSISIDQTLSFNDGLLNIHSVSPTFTADLVAYMEQGKYTLKKSGQICFTMTPELFERIASRGRTTSLVRLVNPTKTLLTIEKLSLPIDFEDLYPNALNFSGLAMEAELNLAEIYFTGSPLWGEVSLKQIKSTIKAQESSQNAIWSLRGEADQNGQQMQLKLDATIYKPHEGESFFESIRKQTNLHVELSGVPLVKLDRTHKMQSLMTALLGSRPTIEFDLIDKGAQTTVTGHLSSCHELSAIPHLAFEGHISPQSSKWQLGGKTTKEGRVEGKMQLSEENLEAMIDIGQVTLIEPSHGSSLEFDSIMICVNQKRAKQSLNYEIVAKPSSSIKTSVVTAKGSIGNEWEFKVDVHKCPFPAFARFIAPRWQGHQELTALLGDKMSGECEGWLGEQNGLINLKISSPKASLAANVQIADGVAYLTKDLIGRFEISAVQGKHLMMDSIPLFRSILHVDRPVEIEIKPNGFAWPLSSFSWDNISISQITVNLGKVSFKAEREIQGLSHLLNTEVDKSAQIWFTPIHLSVHRGIIKIKRVDMLFMEEYPLATWGKVDLMKNKVKMILALTKTALNNAFHIEGLQEDYLMPIPLRGDLKKVTIDEKRALETLGALAAKDCLKQEGNSLLNSMLDLAAQKLILRKKNPPPTTYPYPWSSS